MPCLSSFHYWAFFFSSKYSNELIIAHDALGPKVSCLRSGADLTGTHSVQRPPRKERLKPSPEAGWGLSGPRSTRKQPLWRFLSPFPPGCHA